MKFIQRLRNLYKLSEVQISPENKEKISNIITPLRPRQAVIIKKKEHEDPIIKELLTKE